MRCAAASGTAAADAHEKFAIQLGGAHGAAGKMQGRAQLEIIAAYAEQPMRLSCLPPSGQPWLSGAPMMTLGLAGSL